MVFEGTPQEKQYPAGGLWYSHPAGGECAAGGYVGDGSNCTWRVLGIHRIINASCMYQTVDSALEAMDPGCFAACPQPRNTTSTCWLKCFDGVIASTPVEELVKPWGAAFGRGGCPQVNPASLEDLGVGPAILPPGQTFPDPDPILGQLSRH